MYSVDLLVEGRVNLTDAGLPRLSSALEEGCDLCFGGLLLRFELVAVLFPLEVGLLGIPQFLAESVFIHGGSRVIAAPAATLEQLLLQQVKGSVLVHGLGARLGS